MDSFSQEIAEFVKITPAETLQSIIDGLESWDDDSFDLSMAKVLSGFHNPATKYHLRRLLEHWKNNYPEFTKTGFCLALSSASAFSKIMEKSSVEIVWTGNNTLSVPMRQTEQTLLQLIDSSKESLLIVSFAFYKAKNVMNALISAIERGVKLEICVEDSSEKISLDVFKTFSNNAFRQAAFYRWPVEKRIKDIDGNFGSLHAKIALADAKVLFVTSANLTDYAMELNMEMGVLIKGGDSPILVENLFRELIVQKDLQKIIR